MNRLQSATHTGRLREHYSPSLVIPAANRIGWWDAYNVTVATGVSQATDRWGLNNLTQGTAGLQPPYNATGSPNGGPRITPDGSDDLVAKTSATGIGTSVVDMFVLARVTDWSIYRAAFEIGDGTTSSRFLIYSSDTTYWNMLHADAASSVTASETGYGSTSTWYLVRGYVDTGTGKVGLQVNGAAPVELSDALALSSKDKITLCGGTSLSPCQGDIAFALAANTILTLAQRVHITRYVNYIYPSLAIPEPSA